MNRKSLSALIALALGAATTVQAQDYDDRWYFAPYLGYYNNDDDRLTDDGSLLIGGGIGRYVAPNASVEFFIDRTSRSFNNDKACAFLGECSYASDFQAGVSGRFYFGPADGFAPFGFCRLGNGRTDRSQVSHPAACANAGQFLQRQGFGTPRQLLKIMGDKQGVGTSQPVGRHCSNRCVGSE